MKISTKIFLGYFLIVGVGFYFFVRWIQDDVRQNYLESMEEMMVDTANILAEIIGNDMIKDGVDPTDFREAFKRVYNRELAAKIYKVTKSRIDLNVYVTNPRGIVIFDSNNDNHLGEDFSKWNDVFLTLRGDYGARSTRIDKDDPASSIMYVAAPIMVKNKMVGVITAYKSVGFINKFIRHAKRKIIFTGIAVAFMVLILGVLISTWLAEPIKMLTDYARAIRDGRKIEFPNLGGGEVAALGDAFEEMREALEGKEYVEDYVQKLTHELKSPIAALKGATELLREKDLPGDQREQFINNITYESERMSQIVDHMLQLSILENRREIRDREKININELTNQLINQYQAVFPDKKIVFEPVAEKIILSGEKFLINQAIDNLLRNAIEFTSEKGNISVSIEKEYGEVFIIIEDDGPGIPNYALPKIFDKFYSLPRPGEKRKSTGLGLSIVREIALLHHGDVKLENLAEKGARAILTLEG